MNDKFCAISKYSREELLGQDHRIINSGYHPEGVHSGYLDDHSRRTVVEGRDQAIAPRTAPSYWVDTTIVPFLDNEGKPTQYIAIRTDITERKVAEQLAEYRAREVEAAARVKGEFLANMSHEIRTPMNGIIAMRLCSRNRADARAARRFRYHHHVGEALLVVINDILDFTKLEAGRSSWSRVRSTCGP